MPELSGTGPHAERGSSNHTEFRREHNRRPATDDSLWLLKRGRPEQPLFLVHALDGSITPYSELVRHMRCDRNIYGLQTIGREVPGFVYAGVKEMAAHYVKLVRSVQPEGPYSLGGFCFGGLVAFEMGRQLYAEGQEVAVLALLDTFGPVYPSLAQRISGHVGLLLRLKTKERLAYTWGRLKSLRRHTKVTTPAERVEQEGFILLDAKYKACSYPGRLSLFRAARQQHGFNPDQFSGWKGVAVMGVEVHDVPGDHLSILKEPYVRVLAEKLDDSLA